MKEVYNRKYFIMLQNMFLGKYCQEMFAISPFFKTSLVAVLKVIDQATVFKGTFFVFKGICFKFDNSENYYQAG